MMPDYILYRARITLLTPIHTGASGTPLLHQYDYAIHGGKTWRLNDAAILDTQNLDDPDLVASLSGTPPAELLDDQDFVPGLPFFRYVIEGTPRSKAEGAQISEQIKNVHDQPYLPGSSVKGALRTALAWVTWGQRGIKPTRTALNPSPKFAGQDLERELFGRSPNYDLLRALQVSDSAPVGADRLMVGNAQVLHRSGRLASPIEIEAIKPDTVFELTLKIDTALFSTWAGQNALKGGELLRSLAQTVQEHSAQRVETEAAWFKDAGGAGRIRDFYRSLPRAGLPPEMCLLQVGWGTGWDDKTFGSRLREDGFLEGILAPRPQRGYGIARGKRAPGDPFPRSRRVLVQVMRAKDGRVVERPRSPLGWVLLELVPA